MPGKSFGLRKIGQVFMPVDELNRAVGFYRDVLGVPFLFEAPPRMAFFDLGDVRLMLAEREPGGDEHAGGSILYYDVEDIDGAHSELTGRGVAFDAEPHMIADMGDHELWMAFFHDTEGNQLALMSEVPKG